MYTATTRGIEIVVTPEYMESQSIPSDKYFVWSYKVDITNKGPATVQLLHRHWKIIDEKGLPQSVSGAGVVGVQPDIKPGETFAYTSGVHLSTASGVMMGYYQFKNEENDIFDADIPTFSLDCPHIEMVVH